MEFVTEKRTIFKGLQRVQGVADTKGAIPILSHVLIEAVGNTVWIFATDLKIGIKGSISATVKREGRITLPAKRIFDIVRELPDGNVLLSTDISGDSPYDDQWVKVHACNYKSRLPCMSPEIFPEFPSYNDEYIASFEPETLKNLIKKTILSVSHEEGRPALTGVLMELDGEKIAFVSTDGHRLAYVHTENKRGVEKKQRFILPQKTCSELIKFIESTQGEVLFGISENQAVFRQGDLVVVSRLIEEGQYPRYEGVIPEKGDNPAIIKREELISSLKRVSVLAEEGSGMVRFSIGNNGVELIAKTDETGEARERVPAECDVKVVNIGLSAKYTLDFLSVIDDDDVRLYVKGPQSPALLMPKNSEDHKAVIMPMRLSDKDEN